MAKVKPITINNMAGLNFDHPTLIADNEWADSQNMIQGRDGLWENRQGIKTFDNTVGSSSKVHSLKFWESEDGTRRLTAGSGTALYSYAEGSSYNDGTFTSRQTGFTDADKFSFAQYGDNLIASNGTENMYSTTDNSTWTERSGANTRVANYIHFANDTGFAADVSGARSVVYYTASVPGSPWLFPNSVAIETDNGQVLTGLTNLGPVIIAGKERSIYSVDIATPTREQLDYGEGISSHRSIVKALNAVYFSSDEGIFTLGQRTGTTGSLAATALSEPIQALWERLINKDQIVGTYWPDKRVVLWTVETAEQLFTIVYNIKFGTWSYFVGVNALDYTIYEDSAGDEHLIYGDANIDKVSELFHPNRDDDGGPINSVLTTKAFNFGTDALKRIDFIDISGYGSELMSLDIELFFDDEEIASFKTTVTKSNFVSDSIPSGAPLAGSPLAGSGLTGFVRAADDLEVKYWITRIPLEKFNFRTLQIKMSNGQAGVRWRFRNMVANVSGQPIDLFEEALIT